MAGLAAEGTLQIRAVANKWISDHFPVSRRCLSHSRPVEARDGTWQVDLLAWNGKNCESVGRLSVDRERAMLIGDTVASVNNKLADYLRGHRNSKAVATEVARGRLHELRFGDGITGSMTLSDESIDLLLTDPPYGISNPYTCEKQVPRRLRKDGKDFIMPRGHFGAWDDNFPPPHEWTAAVLPKVKGWAVIFCAQAQIGDYCTILKEHGFVAVGPMVWQKTNPVPFNHMHKPINAWEAVVIGKRPGTKFNGKLVHNVFVYKSPSPQQRIHPTQKPLPLISRFIELFSQPGSLVLDPFAGSATTVVASVLSERRVLAFENDPQYFPAAVDRLAEVALLS